MRVYFDTPTFNRITKDRSSKLADKVSAIGGNMGGHTHIFSRGVIHRVENGWGLTKVAAVLLNGLIM